LQQDKMLQRWGHAMLQQNEGLVSLQG